MDQYDEDLTEKPVIFLQRFATPSRRERLRNLARAYLEGRNVAVKHLLLCLMALIAIYVLFVVFTSDRRVVVADLTMRRVEL